MLGNVDEKMGHKDTKQFSFLILLGSYSPSKQSQDFYTGKTCLKKGADQFDRLEKTAGALLSTLFHCAYILPLCADSGFLLMLTKCMWHSLILLYSKGLCEINLLGTKITNPTYLRKYVLYFELLIEIWYYSGGNNFCREKVARLNESRNLCISLI